MAGVGGSPLDEGDSPAEAAERRLEVVLGCVRAERDEALRRAHRLESMGAVRVVAEPLREVVVELLAFADQRCVPTVELRDRARRLVAGSEAGSSVPVDQVAVAPWAPAPAFLRRMAQRLRAARHAASWDDWDEVKAVAETLATTAGVLELVQQQRCAHEVYVTTADGVACEACGAAHPDSGEVAGGTPSAFGDETLADTVRAHERMLDRLSDQLAAVRRDVERLGRPR